MTRSNFIRLLKKHEIEFFLSGKNIMICCPFHGDNSPSLGVIVNKYKYNCLGCGKRGDIDEIIKTLFDNEESDNKIEFIEEEREESFLRNKLNNIERKRSKIKVLKNLDLNKFKRPYGEYKKYLEKRNIQHKMYTKFNIRCGIYKSDKRIILPVRDEYSRLIFITGRSITTNNKRNKVRKSENSDSSKVLYGLYELLKNNYYKKNTNKRVGVLVEGEFDTIYLQQFCLPAFGIGTKIPSLIQLKKISKHTLSK